MRVISGTHKGRRITAPKTLPVRPTTDFAKEALFNILRNRIYFEEISVLDLFSGTGNISYEFASRGTTQVTAVDADFGCIAFIQKTAELLDLPIQTVKKDVLVYLENSQQQFDIIFADPPYNFELPLLERIIETIFQKDLLSEDGIVILEHTKLITLHNVKQFSEVRTYGGTAFSIFKKNPHDIPENLRL